MRARKEETMGLSIVAVGARTPVGLRAESSAAAVRAGISRVRRRPFMLGLVGRESELLKAALDSRLAPEVPGWKRIATLASSAILEVAAKLVGVVPNSEAIRVLLAVPERRPGFSDADAQRVVADVGARLASAPEGGGRSFAVDITGRGHAGAVEGLKATAEVLETSERALCVVCGAESSWEDDTLEWFEAEGRLARKGTPNGFTPGEAAGALLLTSQATARRLKVPSLATVRGLGVATEVEARRMGGGAEGLGEALAAAIDEATAPLRLPEEAVDTTYCDINGERYRTEEWGFALLRVQRAFKATDYQLVTDCWGDVGAATGALGCVLAVQAWRRGYAPGPRALVCASSDGGLRGAAILEDSAVSR